MLSWLWFFYILLFLYCSYVYFILLYGRQTDTEISEDSSPGHHQESNIATSPTSQLLHSGELHPTPRAPGALRHPVGGGDGQADPLSVPEAAVQRGRWPTGWSSLAYERGSMWTARTSENWQDCKLNQGLKPQTIARLKMIFFCFNCWKIADLQAHIAPPSGTLWAL